MNRREAFAIFAVALLVRLVHLWQIRRAPFFDVLMGDSRAYDAWAQRIAGGDWLGSDVFYQAPLYPYFLGTITAIAGHDLLLVRVCQVTLGALSCTLLGLAAARLFSRAAGLLAGFGLALYAPAIFFDSLLQKAVLDIFFICLLLWLMSRILDSASAVRNWLFLGLTMGALALTRENAMVFIVVVAAWALAWPSASPRARARSVGAFILGLAIILVPVAIRNSLVGGGFYITTSQFGPNLYLGNNPNADGTAQSLRVGRGSAEYERQDAVELAEQALGRRLTPNEVSSYWTNRALGFVTSQPGAWLTLMARKFALLWNRTEMLDTESQESYAEFSAPLRYGAMIGNFGVLVPLALIGVWFTWPERKRLWVFYSMIAAYAASVLMFFVYARYRLPLVPFLMLFAAAGIAVLFGELRIALRRTLELTQIRTEAPAAMPSGRLRASGASASLAGAREQVGRAEAGGRANPRRGMSVGTRRGWGPGASEKKLAVSLCGLVGVVIFTNWPVLSADVMRAVTEHNLGAALQSDGRVDEAIAHYRRALSIKADHAPALNNLGSALAAKGDVDQAIAHYQQALAIAPDYATAHYNLANALLKKGQPHEASGHLRQALQSTPGSAEIHTNLGVTLADEGRYDEAIPEFRKALEFDPASAIAHRNLGNVLASAGRREEAVAALRQALALDPRDGPSHYDLATLLVESERMPDAITEFRKALELMPESVEVLNNLGIALGSVGELDEAIETFRKALSLQPDFAQARQNLAAAQQHLRLKSAARP
jgi:tetratricopeptide (TPR) repeat protein/4-amino-4-deoxy-L-arabinose transferase-like glycosyltransferase